MTPKEALRLTGFETFALDYNAPWPVSLVLSRRAITKYQLLFRHVFHCKHVERRLCEAWQTHQATRAAAAQTTGADDGGSLGRAYALSQRMLHFLQNFTYYLGARLSSPTGTPSRLRCETRRAWTSSSTRTSAFSMRA